MENVPDGKIPLGLCRQAVMKLDSFIVDINEIMEDPDVEDSDRMLFGQMVEYAGIMMANIVNIVSRECGEEEFLAEQPGMDQIDAYPGTEDAMNDPMDEEI